MIWEIDNNEDWWKADFFKKNLYWSVIALQWCVSFSFITN